MYMGCRIYGQGVYRAVHWQLRVYLYSTALRFTVHRLSSTCVAVRELSLLKLAGVTKIWVYIYCGRPHVLCNLRPSAVPIVIAENEIYKYKFHLSHRAYEPFVSKIAASNLQHAWERRIHRRSCIRHGFNYRMISLTIQIRQINEVLSGEMCELSRTYISTYIRGYFITSVQMIVVFYSLIGYHKNRFAINLDEVSLWSRHNLTLR